MQQLGHTPRRLLEHVLVPNRPLRGKAARATDRAIAKVRRGATVAVACAGEEAGWLQQRHEARLEHTRAAESAAESRVDKYARNPGVLCIIRIIV